ncbi:expressed unknown protein [Ectocarpus siliculosus]|uniref:BAH domain-containing protein n=1 Tax=Ectocarpus siliculosus TaxID=2880 RepID=D7G9E4_ECTSI|nr:expressed unknown protein [Ectocarpus siliculosus]|eukprot:CBJ28284.1 expressed unknown protein [Ectocarpus siliculosus]
MAEREASSSAADVEEERRLPSGGRRRYVGSVELGGAAGQVNTNDVVEIADQPGRQQQGAVAQVLSMWEDDLTGAVKFRARWLVRSSDLSKEALSRLRTGRSRSAGDGSGEEEPDLKGNSLPDQSRETDDDDGEVFLTTKEEDLDADAMVKPVAISVAASATIDTLRKPKRKTGPRLTHAFDASSGDFTPVKDTHAIITRARARQAEGLASASSVPENSAAGKGSKPVAQGRPWFLPKRKESQAAGRGRDMAETPARGTSREQDSSVNNGHPSVATDSEDRGIEKDEHQEGSDDNDDEKKSSRVSDAAAASAPPASADSSSDEAFTPRKSGRQKKLRQSPNGREAVEVPWHGRRPGVSEVERQGPPRPARSRRLVMTAADPPRTRRLAMPPADTAGAAAKCAEGGAVPHAADVRGSPGSVRTRRSAAGAAGAPPSLMGGSTAPTAKLILSGKRKRTPTAKRMEGDNESCEAEAPDFIPPRRTLVGEDHQVDIPDVLPAEDRSKAAAAGRAEGTGAEMCEEAALEALVKTNCVLDNFEPALKMLADSTTSPESLQPWSLDQVRTLEAALDKDFDVNGRSQGWARPGIDMDREDCIDIAKVSKEVPGKTPAQVLQFYFRYLAAARPLTDVVYGPEAAEARKREKLSGDDSDVEVPVTPRGAAGRPARSGSDTTPSRRVTKQEPAGTRRVSPSPNGSEEPREATTSPKGTGSRTASTSGLSMGGDGPRTGDDGSGSTHGTRKDRPSGGNEAAPGPLPRDAGGVLQADSGDDRSNHRTSRTSAPVARGPGEQDSRSSQAVPQRRAVWRPILTPAPNQRPSEGLSMPPRSVPGRVRDQRSDGGSDVVMAEGRSGFGGGDQVFGFMAPCWHLLERAQAYMDPDQLSYMKGLILAHLRRPMSRDQFFEFLRGSLSLDDYGLGCACGAYTLLHFLGALTPTPPLRFSTPHFRCHKLLKRVKSCLHEQQHIYTAFVKMFDHVDQTPLMPLFPATRRTPAAMPPRGHVPHAAVAAYPPPVEGRPYMIRPGTTLGSGGGGGGGSSDSVLRGAAPSYFYPGMAAAPGAGRTSARQWSMPPHGAASASVGGDGYSGMHKGRAGGGDALLHRGAYPPPMHATAAYQGRRDVHDRDRDMERREAWSAQQQSQQQPRPRGVNGSAVRPPTGHASARWMPGPTEASWGGGGGDVYR